MTTENQIKTQSPFFESKTEIETLAWRQGVAPVTDFDALLGDFWPEEESTDDLISTLRRWRSTDTERGPSA